VTAPSLISILELACGAVKLHLLQVMSQFKIFSLTFAGWSTPSQAAEKVRKADSSRAEARSG
jgi:hypothetical protein